jgi:RNA polymerase sigma factor (sigma-70 family)
MAAPQGTRRAGPASSVHGLQAEGGCGDRGRAGHLEGVEVVDSVVEERFRTLYAAHYTAVFRYVRRRISGDLAADATSEVFLVAWRRLPDVPTAPLPWLYAVARRVVANQRRSAARSALLANRIFLDAAAQTAGTDGVEDRVASSIAFAAAFSRLPDDDREVLGLIAWEGLTARDAATVLGCSTTAVTMRIHRARQRLRAELESEPEEN